MDSGLILLQPDLGHSGSRGSMAKALHSADMEKFSPQAPHRQTPETRRLSEALVYAIVALSAAPGLLILFGVNLGVTGTGADVLYVPAADTTQLHQLLRGSFLHTLLEWSGVIIGIIYATFCLLDYRLRADRAVLVMGVALLCAAVTDAFHTLAADRLILHVSDNANFIPFTWALSRMTNVLVLTFGISIGLFLLKNVSGRGSVRLIWAFAILALFVAIASIWYSATTAELTDVQLRQGLIKRPFDLLPLFFYAGLLPVLAWKLDQRQQSFITHSMLLSLIPAIMTQIHMAFGSAALFDAHFNAAHFLKMVSYMVPLIGLYAEYSQMVSNLKKRESSLEEQATILAHANKRLFREISERERTEAKLSQHAEHLRMNNEELEQFAFIASHDLREPLRKILIFTSRLERSALINEDPKVRELVDNVSSASQRMMGLLESLQHYTQISGGDNARDELVLRELLEELRDELADRIRNSQAEIIIGKLPVLQHVDAGQMRHLFRHLLENALTHTVEGRAPVIHVDSLPHQDSDRVRICVADNGPGIDPQFHEKVFQIFQRLKRDHSIRSTGVGLTLCRRICHRHKGELFLESEIDKGCRFIIELPA